MRKFIAVLTVALFAMTGATQSTLAANPDPGGFKGFISGCCFGLRVGADYNDLGTGEREFVSWFLVGCCFGPRAQHDYANGKDFHWREIGRLVPYVGVIFAIWDGATIGGGKGRSELQAAYGANYY